MYYTQAYILWISTICKVLQRHYIIHTVVVSIAVIHVMVVFMMVLMIQYSTIVYWDRVLYNQRGNCSKTRTNHTCLWCILSLLYHIHNTIAIICPYIPSRTHNTCLEIPRSGDIIEHSVYSKPPITVILSIQ